MTKKEAIKYFGSVSALAKSLNITTQAVYDWGDVIPVSRQYQLQVLSNGLLMAEQTTQVA